MVYERKFTQQAAANKDKKIVSSLAFKDMKVYHTIINQKR